MQPYPGMPPAPEPSDDGVWHRLDTRTVLTYPFAQGGPLIVVILIAAIAGGAIEGLAIRLGVTVAILGTFGAVHWWRFRYRLVQGRLETQSGLISRKSKVINVDRIRGVDIEAKLAHRIAGVCALRIEHPGAAGGSRGRNRDGRDRIDAVSRAEAERLRNALLHDRAAASAPVAPFSAAPVPGAPVSAAQVSAAPVPGAPVSAGQVSAAPDAAAQAGATAARADPSGAVTPGAASSRAAWWGADADRVLFRMPVRWLGYAPFSLRLLFLGPAALLGVFNSLRDANVRSGHDVSALTHGAGWPLLAVLVVVVLVLTAIGSGAVTYWHWTVTARGDDVVLTRGLLTRRTVAIERRRLRGVLLREPLAGRAFRAATLQVVLSGVTGNVRSALVPLGPRRALTTFGHEFVPPCRAPVRIHPRGAYRRRMRRSLVPAAALLVAALVTALAGAPVDVAAALGVGGAVAIGIGVLWARASYATLGHAVDERVLFARHGVIVRHTETVQRSEPIGLRIRQSIFARRAGVASVDVALVARGFTRISDLEAADVRSLAVTLLGPF